ncbi:hypothetical protein [Leuconostoc mesenteroides]
MLYSIVYVLGVPVAYHSPKRAIRQLNKVFNFQSVITVLKCVHQLV